MLYGKQVELSELVHRLEDALKTISPLSEQQLSRKIERTFKAFNPVQKYLEKLPEATEEDKQMYYKLSERLFGVSDQMSQVIGKHLGEVLDNEKKTRPVKLARSRVAGKAADLLFRQLVQELRGKN